MYRPFRFINKIQMTKRRMVMMMDFQDPKETEEKEMIEILKNYYEK